MSTKINIAISKELVGAVAILETIILMHYHLVKSLRLMWKSENMGVCHKALTKLRIFSICRYANFVTKY